MLRLSFFSSIAIALMSSSCVPHSQFKQRSMTAAIAQNGKVYKAHLKQASFVVRKASDVKILKGESVQAKKLAQDLARSQYEYTLGYFVIENGQAFYEGLPNIVSIRDVSITEVEVQYELDFSAVLDSNLVEPFKKKPIFLPKFPDSDGLVSFYTKYSKESCGTDHSHSDSDLEAAQRYFYFFRPVETCSIVKNGANDLGLSKAFIEINGIASDQEISKKRPEYDRVWNDNVFKAVVLVSNIGESEEPFNSDLPAPDAGEAAANMLYRKLRLAYPKAEVTIVGDKPGIKGKEPFAPSNWQARFRWSEGSRKVDILLLFPKFYDMPDEKKDADFIALFKEETLDADLISYSGHSSFGDAVKVFTSFTNIKPDHWRMFYVNSCWSAGYLLEAGSELDKKHLFSLVEEKNPGVQWSRDLDLLLNVSSSNMFKAPANMLALIQHFLASKASYAEIINSLTKEGEPLVYGEHDNSEPK